MTGSKRWHALAAGWPLALYTVLSLAFWGPWVLDAPRSTLLAANDVDPSVYLWFFSWWPHALLDGLNPFHASVIFVPDGYNLAWVTSMPGPSMLLAPVTLTLGPVATWNLIAFAAPAVSAWTAFLLCRHITGAQAPALVGGYLFGFSPYMLAAMTGAPQLSFVALLPVFALLTLRHVEGSRGDRSFLIGMTAALTAQIYLSTEVLATSFLFGGGTLVAAYLLAPKRRAAMRRTVVLMGGALGATALLATPLLYYILFQPRTLPLHALKESPADLLSFVVPPPLVAASAERVGSTNPDWAGGSTYFGIPLLALVGAFAWVHRRTLAARLAVIAFLIASLAALGSRLQVGGTETGLPLPWTALIHLPFLRYAIPPRFSVFAFLAAGVIVSLWLVWRQSPARWGLVAVVLVSLVPAVGNSVWHIRISDPPFFATDLHEKFVNERDRVLTIPAIGPNMRWQARADFTFEMAAGYVGQAPRSYTSFPIWRKLVAAVFDPRAAQEVARSPGQLRRFIEAKGVTVILTDAGTPEALQRLFGSVGGRRVEVGGVLLYRVAPPPTS